MKLHTYLKPDLVCHDCTALSTEALLKEMVRHLKDRGYLANEKQIFEKLMEREKLGSTSIGNHAAVPHTKLKEIKEPLIAVGVSREGFLYNPKDKEPVHLVILILSPNNSPIIHLQILAAAASLIKKKDRLIKGILAADSSESLVKTIKKYETEDD